MMLNFNLGKNFYITRKGKFQNEVYGLTLMIWMKLFMKMLIQSKKYKIPATGFIITGHVGEENFHNLDMISKKELKEMYKTGLWEFETHTHDLHNLSKIISQN